MAVSMTWKVEAKLPRGSEENGKREGGCGGGSGGQRREVEGVVY